MDIKEDDIVDLIRSKSNLSQAFDLIVERYKEPLYWHIRRMVVAHQDADDVIQNVYIKVWQNLEKFNAESKLYTWLYRIATNESINYIKKRDRNLNVSLDNSVIQIAGSSGGFSGDEIQLKLQKAILTLPDKQRAVFNLKYFEDKKYTEIADILDTSVGALKASYHHAVTKIKEYFESN